MNRDKLIEAQLLEQDMAIQGALGRLSEVVSCEDGRKLAEYRLDELPVWDGMAATSAGLFRSTDAPVTGNRIAAIAGPSQRSQAGRADTALAGGVNRRSRIVYHRRPEGPTANRADALCRPPGLESSVFQRIRRLTPPARAILYLRGTGKTEDLEARPMSIEY